MNDATRETENWTLSIVDDGVWAHVTLQQVWQDRLHSQWLDSPQTLLAAGGSPAWTACDPENHHDCRDMPCTGSPRTHACRNTRTHTHTHIDKHHRVSLNILWVALLKDTTCSCLLEYSSCTCTVIHECTQWDNYYLIALFLYMYSSFCFEIESLLFIRLISYI